MKQNLILTLNLHYCISVYYTKQQVSIQYIQFWETLACHLKKNIFSQIQFTFLVPPDILDYPTSSDMVVHEGSNVTLQCAATGYPSPTITWRREDNHNIVISNTLTGKLRLLYRTTIRSYVTKFKSLYIKVIKWNSDIQLNMQCMYF